MGTESETLINRITVSVVPIGLIAVNRCELFNWDPKHVYIMSARTTCDVRILSL